jgi:hypothetical protein
MILYLALKIEEKYLYIIFNVYIITVLLTIPCQIDKHIQYKFKHILFQSI